MTTRAADAYDEIRSRVAAIREAERPMCPISTSRTLYDCLRATARCGDTCPHKNDWMGPQP